VVDLHGGQSYGWDRIVNVPGLDLLHHRRIQQGARIPQTHQLVLRHLSQDPPHAEVPLRVFGRPITNWILTGMAMRWITDKQLSYSKTFSMRTSSISSPMKYSTL